MNWLITGGCGFFGRAFIARLLAEGDYGIRACDNLLVATRDDLAAVTTYVEGEVLNDSANWREGSY